MHLLLISRMCKQQRPEHRCVRVCLRMCEWGALNFEDVQAPEARAQVCACMFAYV